MLDDHEVSVDPRRRQTVELAVWLAMGSVVSGLLVRRTLATVALDWRIDAAVGVMTTLLLAPSGIVWLVAARLFLFRRPARWTLRDALWLATSLVELAWCGVFLDNGLHLGHAGKFLCGVGALLGSPALGLAAVALVVSAFRARSNLRDLWDGCGILLALTVGVGWGMFLWVLLPLRF